ncbi:MAG: hypothetical protein ACYC5G_04060 [Candidatus Doudnabacteria bacterium]
MELIVDNNTRIINDGVFLCVQTKKITGEGSSVGAMMKTKYENVGKERWISETYHSRMKDAVKSLVEKGSTFEPDSKAVIEFYDRIMKLIEERV